MSRKIDLIVLHTSATRANMDIGAADIRKWHKAQGWKDIGYHYVIRRDGKLEKGRPETQVGAHVAGHNSNSIGICLVGGLNNETAKPENNYTDAQWKSLGNLVAALVNRYPNATICGHRDLSPDKDGDKLIEKHEFLKECPCFSARTWAKENGFPIDPKLNVYDDKLSKPVVVEPSPEEARPTTLWGWIVWLFTKRK